MLQLVPCATDTA